MTDEALRELPPGQALQSKLRALRLAPLCILVVVVLVMTVIGVVHKQSQSPLGEGVPESTAEPGVALDASCTPAFDDGADSDAWTARAESSEAVWAEHAGEVGGYTMQGDDGYLLLGEDHWRNISQSVGRDVIDDEHMEAWYAYFNNMRADLASVGTELYIAIAPAKWQIMPSVLPDWAESIRGPGNYDQLLDTYPDLPWVDVRPAMQEAAVETPLYTPLNSHWSDYGAYVAFTQVLACMAASDEQFATLSAPSITGTVMQEDTNEFVVAGDTTAPGLDFSAPVHAEDLGDMQLTRGDGSESVVPVTTTLDMLELPATTINTHADSDLNALVIRDSTGTALDPVLQSTFAQTLQIRHNLDDPANMPDVVAAAEEADADVALLVFSQRYLEIVPGVVQ